MIKAKGVSTPVDPTDVDRWLWVTGNDAIQACTPELLEAVSAPEPEAASVPPQLATAAPPAAVPERAETALPTNEAAPKAESTNDAQEELAASHWARGRQHYESALYAEALDSFTNLLAIRPAHRAASFNVAVCLERLGRYAEAEPAYRHALDLDPTQPDLNRFLGWCLIRLDKDKEAGEAFDKCLSNQSSSREARFGKAVVCQRLGRFDDAFTLYSSIPADDVCHVETLSNMLAIAAARKDYSKQRELGEELLKLRRQSRPALEALMQAEMAAGDYKAAAQRGIRLVKRAVDSYEAWFNLGLCYQNTNRAEQAAQAYTEAIKIRPDGTQALCNLGVLLRAHGDQSGARREFEKVLELDPGDVCALWNLAIVYEKENQAAKAEKIYLGLLREHYQVYAVAFRLGRLRMQRKNYIGAADAFERCLLEKNGDPAAEINLALAQSRAYDPASASPPPSALLSKHADSQEALGLRAQISIDENDWRTASEVELRLRQLGENTAVLAYNIGVLQQRENLMPEAILSYQQASEQRPGFAEALVNCGNASLQAGQTSQARAAWQAALVANPDLAGYYFKGATAATLG